MYSASSGKAARSQRRAASRRRSLEQQAQLARLRFSSRQRREREQHDDGRVGDWDRFRYDPEDPVPSLGGNDCRHAHARGPMDQRPVEGCATSWCTSDYLDEEIEVTGPVKVVLHASSDAVDTDFVAKLVDVYPDGSTYDVAEGILRARYRDGAGAPKLLTPARSTRWRSTWSARRSRPQRPSHPRPRDEQPLPAVQSRFKRLEKSRTTTEVKVGNETIYHDAARPSHVLLPVNPARK